MKFTNKHNLPGPLFRALTHDAYDNPAKFSATSLIKPPRMRVLEQRHWDELEEDAIDRIWIMWGNIVHEILAKHGGEDEFIEQRLFAQPGDGGWAYLKDDWSDIKKLVESGVVVIGSTNDRLTRSMILQDWKNTSVWSWIIGGLKNETTAQLNIYAWLYELAGFRPQRLEALHLYRDWRPKESKTTRGYPPKFQRIVAPMWGHRETDDYIDHRVSLHLRAELMSDDELPPCLPEERWAKDDKWAVIKKGNKGASRVLDDVDEAMTWANENLQDKKGKMIPHDIVFRRGESTRCKQYCAVRDFCNQNPHREK